MTHDELLERVAEAMDDTYDVNVTTRQTAQAAMTVIAYYCTQQEKVFKDHEEWDAEDAFKWLAMKLRR